MNAPVVGYDDYDPWGYILANRSQASTELPTTTRNKFTEKEWDDEFGLNWNYFGARYYDGQIGRWMNVDPLAVKYPGWSPYNYVLNNPARLIDPNGEDVQVVVNQGDSTITVSATIYIYGSGASRNVANRMQQNINNAWNNFTYTDPQTGIVYTVNSNITVEYIGSSEPLMAELSSFFGLENRENYIEVPRQLNRSFVLFGYMGEWRGNGNDPAPHEFGHLFGLGDQYDRATGQPLPGWSRNIMAEPAGHGTVDQRNIDRALAGVVAVHNRTVSFAQASYRPYWGIVEVNKFRTIRTTHTIQNRFGRGQ